MTFRDACPTGLCDEDMCHACEAEAAREEAWWRAYFCDNRGRLIAALNPLETADEDSTVDG